MATSALGFRGKIAFGPLVAIALLAGLLGACEADGQERVAALVPESTSASSSPSPGEQLEQLKQLDLARTGTILAERSGRGVAEPAELDTDGSYAFRAVCTGGGRMRVRTHASGGDDVAVRCDGYPNGMRYLNDFGVEVWSVDAGNDQEWSIVWVDRDDERG